jgi:hypothetical protein
VDKIKITLYIKKIKVMLISSFLIFLVYSTFSNAILINRLGTLMIIFTFILYINSINIIGLTPGLTLYNN